MLEGLMDHDERQRERRERLEAERKVRGEPEPAPWVPPTPEQMAEQFGKRTKKRKRR
jgi:hypothetical protein